MNMFLMVMKYEYNVINALWVLLSIDPTGKAPMVVGRTNGDIGQLSTPGTGALWLLIM